MVFDSISSNVDEVLLINLSANVFVFGDFKVHHKVISNDLTHVVNFPTWIPISHSPALLDLFISSDASICSTMVFPPLGNFDHVVVSVSILTFHQTQTGCPFHGIAYDYSRADWDHLCDPLRDVS